LLGGRLRGAKYALGVWRELGRYGVKLPADRNILDGFPKFASSGEQLSYKVTLQNYKTRLARVILVPYRFVIERRDAMVGFQVFVSHCASAPVTNISLVIPPQLLGPTRPCIEKLALISSGAVALRQVSHVHRGGSL
jgi:hypothetical protein